MRQYSSRYGTQEWMSLDRRLQWLSIMLCLSLWIVLWLSVVSWFGQPFSIRVGQWYFQGWRAEDWRLTGGLGKTRKAYDETGPNKIGRSPDRWQDRRTKKVAKRRNNKKLSYEYSSLYMCHWSYRLARLSRARCELEYLTSTSHQSVL